MEQFKKQINRQLMLADQKKLQALYEIKDSIVDKVWELTALKQDYSDLATAHSNILKRIREQENIMDQWNKS